MVIEKIGNLLKEDVFVVAHQTNCRGVMGAGIAKQIKNNILSKNEYLKYVTACNENGAGLLGHIQILEGFKYLVINCFGEDVPTGYKQDTNYDALHSALLKTKEFVETNNVSIGFPGLMGCGLAGGDWNIVRKMIYDIFSDIPQKVVICYFDPAEFAKYNPDAKGNV